MKEVEHRLRVDEEVIRWMTLKQALIPSKQSKPEFLQEPPFSEAEYDLLKKTTNIDYYAARTLLMTGKITKEELETLGRRSDDGTK
jgi:hypothetical protein